MTAEMLYQILRTRIHEGKLPVNSRMPSEAELCAEHRLSRGTVRAALQRLADEGYLRAGQGRQRIVQRREPLRLQRLRISSSSYVERLRSPSFGDYLRSLGVHPADIVLKSETGVPCLALSKELRFDLGSQVSSELGITPNTLVHWFLRLRLANDDPIALQWAVIPAEILQGVPLDYLVPGGLTQLYVDHGIERSRVRSAYSPTRAAKPEANSLRVSTGAPLIEERRVSYYVPPAGKREVAYEYLVSLYTERIALTFEWIDRAEPQAESADEKPHKTRHRPGRKQV